MNNLFIRGITIDWKEIEKYSYLRKIKALKGLERLEFNKPITFFVGELWICLIMRSEKL